MNEQLFVLTNQKKKTNHVLHLLLCIPTIGFWVIPWLIIASSNSAHNSQIDGQINNLMHYKVQGLSDVETFNRLKIDANARRIRDGRIFMAVVIAITIGLFYLLKD